MSAHFAIESMARSASRKRAVGVGVARNLRQRRANFFKFPNFLNAFRFSFSQKVCALASDAVHKNVRRRRNARSSLRGVWHRGCARSASLSRKFGEKCGNSLQNFCDFDAQRSNKTRPACAATNKRHRRSSRSSRWRVRLRESARLASESLENCINDARMFKILKLF